MLSWRDSHGLTPLDILLRRMSEVAKPPPSLPPSPRPLGPEACLPSWCGLSKYAPQGGSNGHPDDMPPFADVALEVEDSTKPGARGLLWAHRVVLSAHSGAFHSLMEQLRPGEVLKVDPQCCRSLEVLRSAVGFMYTGELHCSFGEDGFLFWQLLCLCTRYLLPAPLAGFARGELVRSLRQPRFSPVVPVLLEAAERIGLEEEEACFVACTLLSSPEALGAGFPTSESRAQALLAALSEVERWVCGPCQRLAMPSEFEVSLR